MQLINLKLLPKFHVARPNRSRVISKSLKSHTHWLENDRVKTKEHETRASVVLASSCAGHSRNECQRNIYVTAP